jgi:predicted esterase
MNHSIKSIDSVQDPKQVYVILFHGFGADMHDLASLQDILNPSGKQLNWIFPQGIHSVPIGPYA